MPLLKPEPFVFPDDLLQSSSPLSDGPGRWWALHTRPRAEKALARKFLEREVPFFLPVHEQQWRNQGRLFRSYLPLFPGYIFLHGDDDLRCQATLTHLVANVLAVEDQRRLHADLARVYRLITAGAALTPEERVGPGDPVTITHGPFAGVAGKVIRKDKQCHFVVEVEFLRRAVSVEIDGWMIQPREPAYATGSA